MLKYFRALKSRSNETGIARGGRFSRRFFPFSVRITREGVLFLAGVLVLSLAAVNTGNNLLFIVLAAMLSTVAVSGIVSRNSVKQVSLSLQLPENVFAGERVSIKISITNLKRIFPSFSIRVEDPELNRKHSSFLLLRRLISHPLRQTADNETADRAMLRNAAYFPILRAGETRSELTVQSFPMRGIYSLDGFWISTRFLSAFSGAASVLGPRGMCLYTRWYSRFLPSFTCFLSFRVTWRGFMSAPAKTSFRFANIRKRKALESLIGKRPPKRPN